MGNYYAPPVNVGKGATLGKFLVGNGVDSAGWGSLTLSGDMSGALPNGINSLLRRLAAVGVDTSGLSAWNRGLPMGRPGAFGSYPGPGWWVYYTKDPAGGTGAGSNVWVASAGLTHGQRLDTTEPAAFNPRADATPANTRNLSFFTGQPVPWPITGGSTGVGFGFYLYYVKAGATANINSGTLIDAGPGAGNQFNFSFWDITKFPSVSTYDRTVILDRGNSVWPPGNVNYAAAVAAATDTDYQA